MLSAGAWTFVGDAATIERLNEEGQRNASALQLSATRCNAARTRCNTEHGNAAARCTPLQRRATRCVFRLAAGRLQPLIDEAVYGVFGKAIIGAQVWLSTRGGLRVCVCPCG